MSDYLGIAYAVLQTLLYIVGVLVCYLAIKYFTDKTESSPKSSLKKWFTELLAASSAVLTLLLGILILFLALHMYNLIVMYLLRNGYIGS